MAIYNMGQGGKTPLGLTQKKESSYTTTAAGESVIPIGIADFRATDILFVDINGLVLIEGTDYTISGTNVVLTTPITIIGTVVHFVAMRLAEVDERDYEWLKGDPGKIEIVRW